MLKGEMLPGPLWRRAERHADAVVSTLQAARAHGTTVIAASHDADLIAAADRVIELTVPRAES